MTLHDPNPMQSGENAPPGEPVHAPASARVAVDPMPGHRDFTDHTDARTPERRAASGAYDDVAWNGESRARSMPPVVSMGMRAGLVLLGLGAGLGGWLLVRWRRERNRPIKRLRRQAMQAAAELRDRVPSSPEEAVKPAAGLSTALISLAILLWQQSQTRSREFDKAATKRVDKATRSTGKAAKRANKAGGRAADAVSDVDLQKRLASLKKRWDPSRLELEKISISRR